MAGINLLAPNAAPAQSAAPAGINLLTAPVAARPGGQFARQAPRSDLEWFRSQFGRNPGEAEQRRAREAAELAAGRSIPDFTPYEPDALAAFIRRQEDPAGAEVTFQSSLEQDRAGDPGRLVASPGGVYSGNPNWRDRTIVNRLRMMGAGIGIGEELTALGAGIGGLFSGEGFGPAASRSLAEEENEVALYRAMQPQDAAAMELVGALPLAAVPGVAASRAAGLGSRIVTGAAVGGGTGLAYGYAATPGNVQERARGAVDHAVFGLAGGAALPFAAPIGARAANWVRSQFARTLPPSVTPAAVIFSRHFNGTPQQVREANALMTDAQSRGVNLTWPEALSQVSNGAVDLTSLQRVVEQSRGGAPVMGATMSRRAGQVQAAMTQQANRLGPSFDPIRLGLETQRTATAEIQRVTNRINDATRDLYRAAEDVPIPNDVFEALMDEPMFSRAIQTIRTDPDFASLVVGHPNNSVLMLDLVKKHLESRASVARAAGDNFAASRRGAVAGEVRDAATAVSPEYAYALGAQSHLRRELLDPLEAGPVGTLAATSDLAQQLNTLFREAPFENAPDLIGDTMHRLSVANPNLAAGLVRQHAVQVFSEAAQNTRAGPNQFGGASFAAAIAGNPQQRAVLEAAIRALPDGDARWAGFNGLLEVMEATGRRQPPGSPTAFNQQLQTELRRGGNVGTAASLVLSPTEATSFVRGWYNDLRLGRNSEALARIITEPESAPFLMQLARGGRLVDMQRVAAGLLQSGGALTNMRSEPPRTLSGLIPPAPGSTVRPLSLAPA